VVEGSSILRPTFCFSRIDFESGKSSMKAELFTNFPGSVVKPIRSEIR
jgi:hypothetical protein